MSIKLALLKSGEDIVADWRELVLNEGDDKVAAYLASYPYFVTINKTSILCKVSKISWVVVLVS